MYQRLREHLNRYWDNLSVGRCGTAIVTLVAVMAFYALTATTNFSETDDVFAFAYRAENFTLDYISDPRLMLYHMSMRVLYLGAAVISPEASALFLMRTVSLICATFALLVFFRILANQFNLRPVAAGATTVFLAVSYGYWRYAVEAEVYIPSILLLLLVFSQLLSSIEEPVSTLKPVSIAAILSGIAVLFYQPSVLAAFFAFPLLLLYRTRFQALLVYLVLGGSVILAGYLAAYLFSVESPLTITGLKSFLMQRSSEFAVPTLTIGVFVKSIIKSALAFSHDLVSANWMFGFDGVSQLIQRIYPSHVIEEEVFAAKTIGNLIYLPLILLLVLILVVIRLLYKLPDIPWKKCQQKPVLVCITWLVITSLIIGRLNPAGIEAWLMVLPPVWLLLGVFIIEPAIIAKRGGLIWVGVTLLFAINLMGGMVMMWDPDADFDNQKGRWAVDNGNQNDLIIVVDDAGFAEYMRYLSDANVVLIRAPDSPSVARSLLDPENTKLSVFTFGRDFAFQGLGRHIDDALNAGGRIIVFEDFFTWQTENKSRYRPQTLAQVDLMARLQKKMTLPYGTKVQGATYLLNNSAILNAGVTKLNR